jgi:putative transposase
MSRPVRVEFPGACYHVMSHGVNDAPTFLDDLDHRTFLDSLKEFVAIGELIVFAFILMRTHFHLLLQTPMAGLSRHMQRLLGRYTGWFNRRHHRHGHLWQARYKAVVVQDGDYFLHCSRYIHLNPMKAHLCTRPENYPWSSYPCYQGSGADLDWIDTSKTLDCFASPVDYAAFVLQGLQLDLASPFDLAIGGTIFGSGAFAAQLRPLIRTPDLLEDVPETRVLNDVSAPSFDAIRSAVIQTFPGLSECQRRRIFVYALRCFSNATGREIASMIGRTPSAVTHAWRALQTRLASDISFRRQIEMLAQILGPGTP